MQKNRTIILMGIKHSGKSTQGRLLAGHFGCPFIDLDDEILKIFGKSPREIYTEKGPAGFMHAEEEACRKIESVCKNRLAVISTGGGICDNAPALNILRPLGIFVYLDIDEKSACDRILKKAEKLSDGTWKNLPAYIARQNPAEETEIRKIFHAFYEERSKTYRDIADIIVPTTEESKEENTKKILLALES